jgi:hypothetical protein
MAEKLSEVPMVWREQKDNLTDRYFSLTRISGISSKFKHNVQYTELPYPLRPVLHSQDMPVPKPPEKWTTDDDYNDDEPVPVEEDINHPGFQPSTSNEPHHISQYKLNDLVRDLNVSKGAHTRSIMLRNIACCAT